MGSLRFARWFRLRNCWLPKGLRNPTASDDVTVVANGGIDLIHLSRTAFPTMEAQRAILQKITDFVESQPWSGPLFTRSMRTRNARSIARRRRPART